MIQAPSPLAPSQSSRVVHQDMAHQFRRNSEEVRAVLPRIQQELASRARGSQTAGLQK